MALSSVPVIRAAQLVTKERLIVRSSPPDPQNLETPAHLLTSWATPNELFFVRSHFHAPSVSLTEWTLEIDGDVDRPLRLRFEDSRDSASSDKSSLSSVQGTAAHSSSLRRPGFNGKKARLEPRRGKVCVWWTSCMQPVCARLPVMSGSLAPIEVSLGRLTSSAACPSTRFWIRQLFWLSG